MSETSVSEAPLSRREIDLRRSDIFEQYVGTYCGDVYLTALNLFERFSFLRNASVRISSDSDVLAGGTLDDGEPNIHIGTKEGVITPRIKSRIVERFGLPAEVMDMPDGVFKPFILAHEIGHVIQADPLFEPTYGEMDKSHPRPEDDYLGYLQSDSETNADFIAAEIISNTEFGRLIGYMPPFEGPPEWRDWASQHGLDETMRRFGEV